MTFSEADWEAIALDQFAEHGWQHVEGKAIAPGTENVSRKRVPSVAAWVALAHGLFPGLPL